MAPRISRLRGRERGRTPKTGKTLHYHYDAVLEVAGGPARSPYDPKFDPHHIWRVELFWQCTGAGAERTG